MAATRRLTDVGDEPTKRTGCDGSQKAASLAARARDVGRSPSSRRVSTRSSHLPTRVSSIGADARGSASSTTKTPGPTGGRGRPQGIGPSASRPTARSDAAAVRSGVIASDGTRADVRYRAQVMAPRRASLAVSPVGAHRWRRLIRSVGLASALVGFGAALAVPTVAAAAPDIDLQRPEAREQVTLTPALVATLQRRLDRLLARDDMPGVSAAILFPDGTTWLGTSGMADVGKKRAVTPDTAFALASVSKTFTAALIMALRDEGKVDLDGPGPALSPRAARQQATEPQGHGPTAARPYERRPRLLLPRRDRQRAAERHGSALEPEARAPVRRPAVLQAGQGLALLEHQLPAARTDRRTRRQGATRRAAGATVLRAAGPDPDLRPGHRPSRRDPSRTAIGSPRGSRDPSTCPMAAA